MFDKIFFLQLLLTFFVGSAWIYTILLFSQRHGSKIGGFIGGLPSTALLSFFFIGLTQSPVVASDATTVFPVSYAVTAIFLVIYASQAKHGFFKAIGFALVGWFLLSSLLALVDPQYYLLNLILYVVVLIFTVYLMEFRLKIESHKKSSVHYSTKQTVIRAFFAGFVIMLAVLFAKLGGPTFGGIFAAFPAMFISTLTITYYSLGIEFSRAMTKPLMVTGMITIVTYSIAVRFLYIYCGLYLGTLLSILVSAICAYFIFVFIQRKFS